ncbi:hypothetical protein FKM82_026484, partial [Ascaphus truei]
QEEPSPSIEKREGHATDEEKLASAPVPKPVGSGGKGQPEEDQEFFECSNDPKSGLAKCSSIEHLDPASHVSACLCNVFCQICASSPVGCPPFCF